MPAPTCPRCGAEITTRPGAGRPRRWCSDGCRRLASEERRAAERGAIGLRVADRIRVETVHKIVHTPPTVPTAVEVVLGNREATRAVLAGLVDTQRTGTWSRYDRKLWGPLLRVLHEQLDT